MHNYISFCTGFAQKLICSETLTNFNFNVLGKQQTVLSMPNFFTALSTKK